MYGMPENRMNSLAGAMDPYRYMNRMHAQTQPGMPQQNRMMPAGTMPQMPAAPQTVAQPQQNRMQQMMQMMQMMQQMRGGQQAGGSGDPMAQAMMALRSMFGGGA